MFEPWKRPERGANMLVKRGASIARIKKINATDGIVSPRRADFVVKQKADSGSASRFQVYLQHADTSSRCKLQQIAVSAEGACRGRGNETGKKFV
jgi:hypothetical protein